MNALETAREALDHGDDVRVIFDGAGTRWIGQLSDDSHDHHDLCASIEESIHGACEYCAHGFGVRNQVKKAQVPLLDEHDGHPSIRGLLADDYQVLTF